MITTGYTFFFGHTESRYPTGCRHYVFSQWYPCKFTDPLSGTTYSSAEQYMMAKKAELFGDSAILAEILSTTEPRTAKALGRKVANFDEEAWKTAAYDIVVQGNRLKFGQDSELRQTLLATGDTLLVEASPHDRIWGIGLSEAAARKRPESEWPGTNLLGKALTQVREELRRDGLTGGSADGGGGDDG